jgi:hypothetical protein
MPRPIPLSQGKVAWVDPEDFRRVIKIKWHASKYRGEKMYAKTHATVDGKKTTMFLHRFIMGASKGQLVDHKDGDGFNNSRSNLRLATNTQNLQNSRVKTGRFKGVSWNKNAKKWMARIMAGRTDRYLGYFVDENDAARAYDAAARELHGEFARLNFPAEGENSARNENIREDD